jgi:hypothetical protein
MGSYIKNILYIFISLLPFIVFLILLIISKNINKEPKNKETADNLERVAWASFLLYPLLLVITIIVISYYEGSIEKGFAKIRNKIAIGIPIQESEIVPSIVIDGIVPDEITKYELPTNSIKLERELNMASIEPLPLPIPLVVRNGRPPQPRQVL